MPRITISYRRDDSLDVTGRIFDRLAEHFGREAVFRDIDNIPPGVDFRRDIDRVLEESNIVLAIVGPRWIGPDNEQRRLASPADPVRLEIETALRKNKPLIPVLVSRAVMPHPESLPDSLHDFAYRNAIQVDSGQDFDVHVGRLMRAIEQILRLDEERAADEAGPGAIAAIGAAPRVEPIPEAEPQSPSLAVASADWAFRRWWIAWCNWRSCKPWSRSSMPVSRRLGLVVMVVVISVIGIAQIEEWARQANIAQYEEQARQAAGLEPRLELGKVVPTRTANRLVIEGEVTNSGNMPSDVPPLRVALRDAAEKDVQFKIIDPPKTRLAPNETARFQTAFEHPDEAASGVVVTFAR
jgi:hypothetical protein